MFLFSAISTLRGRRGLSYLRIQTFDHRASILPPHVHGILFPSFCLGIHFGKNGSAELLTRLHKFH